MHTRRKQSSNKRNPKGENGMKENGSKKKRKRQIHYLDEVDKQTQLRLRWLTIKEMEHDHKMRRKAIHLSRKRRKQADSWVI